MIKIIIDTDMGNDCDDAGALAIAHALADNAEAELLAVTHCYDGMYPCAAIDSINRYYGRANIPIGGFWKEKYVYNRYNIGYTKQLANEFPNRFLGKEDGENSISVLRKTLQQQEDSSVVLVVIGSLYTMQQLLNSKACIYSPLDGKALISQKISKTVIMAGRFMEYWNAPCILDDGTIVESEFNVKANISAAQEVCQFWPGEIVFTSYEIGLEIKTGENLVKYADKQNPIRRAYEIYCNGERESWDLTAVLYAVRSNYGYWNLSPKGTVTVDSKGITCFSQNSNGKHSFLIPNIPNEEIRKKLNALLEQPPKYKINE